MPAAQKTPEQVTIWTKELITKLILEDDAALCRAVVVIYDRQTADEKSTAETKHDNGLGFTGADAKLLTSFARQIIKRQEKKVSPLLSDKQIPWARKKMKKYSGQLLLVHKEKHAAGSAAK